MPGAMKMLSLAAAACLSGAAAATVAGGSQRVAVTPVEKVLQLLNGMLAQGKEAKHQEEVDFAKFQVWCQSTESATTKSINAGAKQIQALAAEIEKAKADAEVLAKEVAEQQNAAATASADADSAKAVRAKEQADYEAQYQDFSESIAACKRAIEVLKARSADVPQSLLQVRGLRLLPGTAKARLDALLDLHGQADAPPQANAYEFQSGSVIQMLEKLTTDFEDQRLVLQKGEMTAKASFEQLLGQLTNNVASLEKSIAKKTGQKASRLERASAASGEQQSVQANKAQDEKTLAETLAECQLRSAAFEKDQVTRSEEVKALETAVGILSSDSVAGNAATYLPKLLQTRAGRVSALVQLRSRAQGAPEVRRKVIDFLQANAGKINSRYLALVAARLAEDPFAKVIKMIKELITKLSEEANSEADHHAYCTSELATNKQTREYKTAEVEELSAKYDRLSSESARLAGEIAALAAALTELRTRQAEATALRKEDHALNAKTIADAQESQNAVTKATQVLKDFYGKAGEAALLQGGRQAMSEAMSVPYKGQQSESTGIFGLLEVILSDFARLEASTASAEDAAQAAFEKFMTVSTEDIAVKETTKEHEEDAKGRTDEAALDTRKELSLTQEELDSATVYFEKLKADCLDTGLSYEDRVRAREEEVQSLQHALAMLDQQDLA